MPVTPWAPGDDIWIPAVGWQKLPTVTKEGSQSLFKSAAAALAPAAVGFVIGRMQRARK